jgi:hypothetical protein
MLCLCVQEKETLESLESFLNLGADEVDIRTIQSNITVEIKRLHFIKTVRALAKLLEMRETKNT